MRKNRRIGTRIGFAAGMGLLVLAASPAARGGDRPDWQASHVRVPADAARDACALLSDDEVLAVQGQPVIERIGGEKTSRAFRTAGCFYRTAAAQSSVSLVLTLPLAADGTGHGARGYWRETFHRDAETRARKKRPGARTVEGLGDEAFWAGDRRSGALYVLHGDVFLRISLGGAGEDEASLKRAQALASRALQRLGASLQAAAAP
jgi:hypothetical protein